MARVRAIHSGGQSGADQGGLAAGVVLGLKTGGIAPRGWRTEYGPQPKLARLGLVQDVSDSYVPRTKRNVIETDGTLWFGNETSPGGKLTTRTARSAGVPLFVIEWRSGDPLPKKQVSAFRRWIEEHEVRTLNVAGNRESKQPGIAEVVRDFLVLALSG